MTHTEIARNVLAEIKPSDAPAADAPLADWAAFYVDYGVPLVPIPPGTKGPNAPGWNRLEHCVSTLEAAEAIGETHPRHGIGIALGYTDVCSLDVDNRRWAAVALRAVEIDLGTIGSPVGIVGTPGNKRHCYRIPPGVGQLPSRKLEWIGEDKRPICLFELRHSTSTGTTVQDILPPSLHPGDPAKCPACSRGAHPYRWDAAPWEREIPDLPAELLGLWQRWDQLLPKLHAACPWAPAPSAAPRQGAMTSSTAELASRHDVTEQIARARSYLATLPPAVENQGGDRQTIKAANAILDFVLDDKDAWKLMLEYNRRCRPPWAPTALRRKFDNAIRYRKHPRGCRLEDDGTEAELPEPPRRPPADEVAEVWDGARLVLDDPAVHAWLEGRGFDPLRLGWIEDRDLARVLVPGKTLPAWCRFMGKPWDQTGHRLLFKLYGPTGAAESLHARNVHPDCPEGSKAAAAAGAEVRGLVLADALGQLVLETGSVPNWWQDGPLRLVIAEGQPDWLTWATRWMDYDVYSPGVLGVVPESWDITIGSRIPDGSTVAIRTHMDATGDAYAEAIRRTLAGRCTLVRPRPKPEDMNER